MSLEWWWQQTLCGKFFLWNWRSFYVTLWGYSAVQASWTIWLRSSFLPSTLCSIWQVMSLPKPLLWMDLVQACCGFSATCCSFSWCWQAAGMSIDSSNAEWRKMLRSSSLKSWCHGREARTCQWFRRVFSRVYQIFEIVRFKLPHHLDKVADDLLQIFCPESHYSQRVLQRHFHTISMPPQMGQASVDVTWSYPGQTSFAEKMLLSLQKAKW